MGKCWTLINIRPQRDEDHSFAVLRNPVVLSIYLECFYSIA